MLKVKLIAHSPDPQQVVASAYKICYSASGVDELVDNLTPEKTADFLEKVSAFGHESPIEHVTFTFGIEGVSRALMAQMTRHRIASFSVQSQRYVKADSFTFVIPPEIAADPDSKALFLEAMAAAQEAYDKLEAALEKSHTARMVEQGIPLKQARSKAQKLAGEDARFVLPNACETKMIATFNARSLQNFFRIRCCNRAQWEIRELAWQMLTLCRQAAPLLFERAGPSCLFGPCSEGAMSCGDPKSARQRHQNTK
jgi:thymidylate synthase, flavin-dependent